LAGAWIAGGAGQRRADQAFEAAFGGVGVHFARSINYPANKSTNKLLCFSLIDNPPSPHR
jgi:hypothetical protein